MSAQLHNVLLHMVIFITKLFLSFGRSIQEDDSANSEILNGDNQSSGQNHSSEKADGSVANLETVSLLSHFCQATLCNLSILGKAFIVSTLGNYLIIG